jgi:hypothetical protein
LRHVLFNDLKGELALRNIAENSRDDTDERVTHRLVHPAQIFLEYPYQHISEQYEGDGSERIPEQLYPAVQVGFREYDVPRHDEPSRETDSERYHPGRYFWRDGEWSQMDRQFVEDMVERERLYHNVQHRIGAATGQITERLGWYPPRYWLMEEVDGAYYDMSGSGEQAI